MWLEEQDDRLIGLGWAGGDRQRLSGECPSARAPVGVCVIWAREAGDLGSFRIATGRDNKGLGRFVVNNGQAPGAAGVNLSYPVIWCHPHSNRCHCQSPCQAQTMVSFTL